MLNNPFFILFWIKFLSKEASNGEGKTFLLILFHKLQLSETLRLRLQSVASVICQKSINVLKETRCFIYIGL